MNLKSNLQRLNAFFTRHPARFFLSAAVVWMTIMFFLNQKEGIKWDDILVEANGMAFDLLVFGVLLSLYDALRGKRERIERLHEEIDDYRGWDEKEAMYRIVGAVRRLNKEGVSKIDLNRCFLVKADFRDTNLKGANLTCANLERVLLTKVDLEGANLAGANLAGANLIRAYIALANLVAANLVAANLGGANLAEANLEGANLAEANLAEANLAEANLKGVLVGKGWFEKLNKWQVKGREEIQQKYHINNEGRLIENAPNDQV